ncbi:MAG: hypothetical protein KBC64_02340 [Simkaniaceae bacterium]|nr:hypothetical protein [Simkaniaceae bacterium]
MQKISPQTPSLTAFFQTPQGKRAICLIVSAIALTVFTILAQSHVIPLSHAYQTLPKFSALAGTLLPLPAIIMHLKHLDQKVTPSSVKEDEQTAPTKKK